MDTQINYNKTTVETKVASQSNYLGEKTQGHNVRNNCVFDINFPLIEQVVETYLQYF